MFHYIFFDRWICIYPAYIDSNKTRVAGRRVPKSRAVERPTCTEISDVLTAANFKVGVEPKFYSREPSKEEEMRGRVRVQLKNEDGSPVNPAFPSSKITSKSVKKGCHYQLLIFYRRLIVFIHWGENSSFEKQSLQVWWRRTVCQPGGWWQKERQRG